MRYSSSRTCLWSGALLLALVMSAGAVWAAPSVVINGIPLVTQNPPVTMGGSILLPMRDVFTALQAEIKWFAAERKILAIRGDTTIQLVLGSRLAMINNMPMQLPVPATLVGAITYVPLRFPAEAFGGTVRWDGPSQTAFIDIPAGGETTGGGQQVTQPTQPTEPTPPTEPAQPAQPAEPQPVAIEGTLVQVFATANPSLVVQVGAENMRMIQLTPTTVLTRAAAGAEPVAVQLAALQVGDLIQGQITEQGVALTLNATYGEKAGKVAALAGNTLLFEDGETLLLGANVQVVGPNKKTVALATVVPGTQLTARFQPATKVVWRLELAAAPAPPVVQPTKLEIFTVGLLNPGTVFKAGDRLTIQLQGTPGATATISLPDVAPQDVPLPEIAAGIYQANFTVPAQTNARDVVLTGHLAKGALQAAPMNAAVNLNFDSTKPTIQSLTPKANSTITNTAPSIEVAYTDAGGVDVNAAVLRLDGRDVSAQATVTAERLTYAAQGLAAGVHQVVVQIQDLAGNRDSRTWSFTVSAPVVAQPILAVWHDAAGALTPGQTLNVFAQVAQPGGVATFSIGEGWRTGRPMARQGTSAVYMGSYLVKAGDTVTDAIVKVRYTPVGGQPGSMDATNPVSINPVAPVTLEIASPLNGSKVEDQIRVQGHALPNTKVRVTISYKTKLVTTITGQLWQGTVNVGADGAWTTPAVNSDVFLGKANEYTIVAEALNASNAVTATKTIKLVK